MGGKCKCESIGQTAPRGQRGGALCGRPPLSPHFRWPAFVLLVMPNSDQSQPSGVFAELLMGGFPPKTRFRSGCVHALEESSVREVVGCAQGKQNANSSAWLS